MFSNLKTLALEAIGLILEEVRKSLGSPEQNPIAPKTIKRLEAAKVLAEAAINRIHDRVDNILQKKQKEMATDEAPHGDN